MVFHWSLSDSKSPHVSRTRLRILADLSNAVVWIVSTRPPTSKSSRPFNNPLVIVPNAPITIGTIVTFMFHSLFNSLARSRYLSFFSLSFRFILWSAGTAKSTILQILFFFFMLIIMRSGLLTGIGWSVCMFKSHRNLYESLLLFYSFAFFFFFFFFLLSGWFSPGIWVTASLIKSPRLFSVFWPISTILLFELTQLVFLFPNHPVPVPILWWLYQALQLQSISLSLSCSIVFFSIL